MHVDLVHLHDPTLGDGVVQHPCPPTGGSGVEVAVAIGQPCLSQSACAFVVGGGVIYIAKEPPAYKDNVQQELSEAPLADVRDVQQRQQVDCEESH